MGRRTAARPTWRSRAPKTRKPGTALRHVTGRSAGSAAVRATGQTRGRRPSHHDGVFEWIAPSFGPAGACLTLLVLVAGVIGTVRGQTAKARAGRERLVATPGGRIR